MPQIFVVSDISLLLVGAGGPVLYHCDQNLAFKSMDVWQRCWVSPNSQWKICIAETFLAQYNARWNPNYRLAFEMTHLLFSSLFFFGFFFYLTLMLIGRTHKCWCWNIFFVFFSSFCIYFIFFTFFVVVHTETWWHKNWPIRNSLQQGRPQVNSCQGKHSQRKIIIQVHFEN